MTTGISINPNEQSDSSGGQQGFKALVRVTDSRYGKLTYPPELGYSEKIAIVWTMETTKGNTIVKHWSTGLPWDGPLATVSPDGKRLIPKSSDCRGFKANSDAVYLLQQVIKAAKFPESRLTDDMSVFTGGVFYIKDAVNPAWKGSGKKPYPVTYYGDGEATWQKAKAEQAANQAVSQAQYEAKQAGNKFQGTSNSSPAVSTGVTVHPQVVIADDVLAAAGGALMEILIANNGKITKNKLVAALGELKKPDWKLPFRQQVTISLWSNLPEVVASNPIMKLTGDEVSFA